MEHCSFCGKSQQDIERLIKGITAYICDECIQACNVILLRDGVPSMEIPDWNFYKNSTLRKNKCSFCGEIEQYRIYVFAGPGEVFICQECIVLCNEIMYEEVKNWGVKNWKVESVTTRAYNLIHSLRTVRRRKPHKKTTHIIP